MHPDGSPASGSTPPRPHQHQLGPDGPQYPDGDPSHEPTAEPAPSEPAPSEPAPSEPAPSEPRGDAPEPAEPTGTAPAPPEPPPPIAVPVKGKGRRRRKGRRKRKREDDDSAEDALDLLDVVEIGVPSGSSRSPGCGGGSRGRSCDGPSGCGGGRGGSGCDGCDGPCDLVLLVRVSTVLLVAAAVLPEPGGAALVRGAIGLYRSRLTRFTPACPSTPSCSAYALAAVESLGPRRGLAAAARRIRACGSPDVPVRGGV